MGLLDDTQSHDDLIEKSDEEILALSVHDSEHFSVILERYQGAFMRKALLVVRQREDAEDIVQETFGKIYLYAEKFKKQEGASFSSWGYRILLNTSFTHYQRLKKNKERVCQLDPEVYEKLADTKTRQFEKLELSDYIVSILSEVPEHFRRILTMYFLEDKSHKEIAESEGISVGAVKTRVHRAKESFRKGAGSLSL